MRLEAQARAVAIKPKITKDGKVIQVTTEMEYSDQRWLSLGQFLMETDSIEITMDGEPLQPELITVDDVLSDGVNGS